MQTLLEPSPSGTAPTGSKKWAGSDDRCSWVLWNEPDGSTGRCREAATDTVKGKLYCSPHADKAAGI